MKTVIYYNPRCSKSRESLRLLQENGLNPVVINYLETPLTTAELKHLCNLLDRKPWEIIRFKEDIAKEKKLAPSDKRTANEWFRLIIEYPILMERPVIVIDDKKAVLGRPPENSCHRFPNPLGLLPMGRV
jgi:arsenate reductase